MVEDEISSKPNPKKKQSKTRETKTTPSYKLNNLYFVRIYHIVLASIGIGIRLLIISTSVSLLLLVGYLGWLTYFIYVSFSPSYYSMHRIWLERLFMQANRKMREVE